MEGIMENYDVKKERRDLYAARSGRFDVVDVPPLPFLMADGHGDPNTSAEYGHVVEALYTLSYAVRAIARDAVGRVHTVGPLEGLWSADDPRVFLTGDKSAWDWTLMIVQPTWITSTMVDTAVDRVSRSKSLPALAGVRFDEFTEGQCVQTLHVGSYDDEAPTIARMHDEFIAARGWALRGRHHEIYLSDARKTDPSRLRTILRQPIAAANAERA
jgi:hypothetical protein